MRECIAADLALFGAAGAPDRPATLALAGRAALVLGAGADPGPAIACALAAAGAALTTAPSVVGQADVISRPDILIVNGSVAAEAAGPALRAALPAMRARGWGRIVVLAPPAIAAAHGLVALVSGAATAGADRGVTAKLIRLDSGRNAAAAGLVALLCREDAAMVTGAVLEVADFACAP